MFLVSSSSCLCPVHWSHVFSREWSCSWSSTDRWCSNYIWVVNNLIAYKGVTYSRDLTVDAMKQSGNPLTSSNGNMFHITGSLCREFTSHRWIPLTKSRDTALMFSLICVWINSWVNNREAGDLRCHHAHHNVIVIPCYLLLQVSCLESCIIR